MSRLEVQLGHGLTSATLLDIPPKAAGSRIKGILIHSVKCKLLPGTLTLDASADCELTLVIRRTIPARWGTLKERKTLPSGAVVIPASYGTTESALIWSRAYTFYSNASQQAISSWSEEMSWRVGEVLVADTIAVYCNDANISAFTFVLQIDYDLVDVDEFTFSEKVDGA